MQQPTTSLGHVDYLDGWRGLAIGLLLIGHFFAPPGLRFRHHRLQSVALLVNAW